MLLASTFFIPSSSATTAPQYATQWGSYGLGQLGQFAFPQGIAIDSSGNVYVTDLGNRRVEKFDFNGNYLDTWGTKGNGNGQFQSPAGIAVHGTSVYVVDNELNTIQEFDTSGKFITQWGGKGSDNGQFLLPQGIATDPSGDVYVADTGNSRIAKFSPDGKFIISIGQSGLSDGQFLSPRGVTADSQGSIYVADSGNNRIEKFTQDGVFLKTFSASSGSNFKTPLGLSVDSSGNIYVTDTGDNQIVEINKDGNLLTSWGSQGTGPDFFDNPRDVAIDSAGNIYVVDSSNNRIQKFGSLDSPLSQTLTPINNQTQQSPTNQTKNTQLNPNDKTPPTITAPADMTVQASGMLTPVSIGQATATDDTSVTSIVNDAPTKFPLGSTMVTWTATDSGGNIAKAVQKITVIDTTAPTLTAPPNVTVEAKSPDHNSIDLGLPSAYDAVGVLSVTNDAPAYFPLGQTIVTWIAKDASGNDATAKQIVTIQDTTPPTIHAPSDINIEATSATNNVVDLGNATVTDNGIVQSVTNNAPKTFPIGTTTVTWTAKDAAGNGATATQTVKIVDTTAPKITPPKDITFEATSITDNQVPLGNATVTDNGIIQSVTNDAPKSFPLGKTLVLWTAKDAAGNISNATQTVDVVDTTAPKITPPKDIKAEATSLTDNIVSLGNATATDVEQVTITNNATKPFPLGKTLVLWTAKDAAGNISNATQTVDVVDTTAPKITPPKDITFEATSLNNNTIPLGTPSVTDLEQVTTTNNAPKVFGVGLTTVTWTAVDAAGNSANATQTVEVRDTTPPKLIIPKDITVEANSINDNVVSIGKANATDAVGVESISNNAPKTFPIGSTIITWTAKDAAGNISNATQTVDVVDTTAPKITPPKDIKAEATSLTDNIVSLGNATATDVEQVTISNNAPKTFPIGSTIITWTAKDAAGNISNATQTVDVVDTTAPKITPPKDITFEATSLNNNTIPLGNATVIDFNQVTISNNAPKSFPLGKTLVLWTAKDAAGNISNATQTVDVVDTTAPKITPPKDIKAEATSLTDNIVSLGAPTVIDVEQITLTNDAPKSFPLGMTTVTWTAKDAAGNISNATQTVDVVDTTAPKITPPKDIKAEATSLTDNIVSLGNATATDVEQVTISNNAPKTFPIGSTIITWTAKDAAGNISNATQTVDVVDTTAPSIVVPKDIVVNATSPTDNHVDIGNATAKDAVSVASITNDAPQVFPFGQTIVTWKATDTSGNSATATQKITVVDRSPPQLNIPADIVVNATAFEMQIQIGQATATGIIDTSPKITNNATATFPLGKTIVEWNATDKFGNTKSLTQSVTVLACGKPESSYNLIMGTENDDTLIGKIGISNLIIGLGGNDIIRAGSSGDCIISGNGDNVIFGGAGDDTIIAGNGNNIIKGDSGNDKITVGTGSDIIDGGDGNNSCTVGNASHDTVVNCEIK